MSLGLMGTVGLGAHSLHRGAVDPVGDGYICTAPCSLGLQSSAPLHAFNADNSSSWQRLRAVGLMRVC